VALGSPEQVAVEPFLVAGPRRNAVTMTEQARLALVYVLRVNAGECNPARVLATRYAGTSEKTWMNRFNRLRSLGLLTPAPRRGVAGGTLTDLGLELLGVPGLSPDLIAAYESDAEALPLTDAQALELAGLADWEIRQWLADNPTAGAEDQESWWNRVADRAPSHGGESV
jgi:hypothetical protein